MADNYREVKRGVIEVPYYIVEHDLDDGTHRYDWHAGGDDSDEWFDTAEEAEEDARYHLG